MGGEAGPALAGGKAGLDGLRVLVAEDEGIVAMGLVDIVEDSNGQVIGPFASVAGCFAAIEDDLPDLAILDLRLEDGESLEIASRLNASGVPIVFHSGHMVDQEWQASSGTVLYCSKPCPESDMTEALLTAAASC